MKKTFDVNINGKIFHIDEDAYELLQNYLSQLREAFPGEEGQEIVSDIECRISEHFEQRVGRDPQVIVLEDVNNVIGVMGRPEEISGEAEFVNDAQAESHRPDPAPWGSSAHGADDGQHDFSGAGSVPPPPLHKKLFRDERHKVFGGVIAGLGQYLGWDVTVLRILTVVLTLSLCRFDLFWAMIMVYLICWMVIPPARTPRQILEMRGEPVTVDNVGQTVIDNTVPPAAPVPSGSGFAKFINNVFLIVGKVIVCILGIAGAIIAATTGIVGLVIIAGMCCLFFGASGALLDAMDISLSSPYLEGWGIALVLFAVMLPAICLCWAGFSSMFRSPKMSTTGIIVLMVIEVLMIVGAVVLLNIGGETLLHI